MPDNTPLESMPNGELYHPSSDFIAKANVQTWELKINQAKEDLPGFWAERALELEWYQPWNKVLDDSNKPFYKWFVGAKVNIVYNCLDRYIKTWRKNKLALIWEGEPRIRVLIRTTL